VFKIWLIFLLILAASGSVQVAQAAQLNCVTSAIEQPFSVQRLAPQVESLLSDCQAVSAGALAESTTADSVEPWAVAVVAKASVMPFGTSVLPSVSASSPSPGTLALLGGSLMITGLIAYLRKARPKRNQQPK
jgi:hypothetical protein